MYSWSIPSSKITSNREWEKKIHFGYWCICYDVVRNNKKIRMVLRASNDSNKLEITGASVYLVDPEGKRLEN